MVKTSTKGKRTVAINMEGVETSTLIPEGDYEVKVSAVTQEESASTGKPYLKWVLIIAEGPLKGQKIYHNTSLQPQALFNLKNVLLSLGVAVPNSILKLNLDDLEDETMGITVAHEMYEGKKKHKVAATFPLDETEEAEEAEDDESDEEEDSEEESEGEEESEDEDSEDDEEVDFSSMNLAELLRYAKDNGIELDLSIKDKRNIKKVREALEAAFE